MTLEYEIQMQKERLIEEGLIKGREEERKATALRMAADGFPDETIARCLGVSVEEVHDLLIGNTKEDTL